MAKSPALPSVLAALTLGLALSVSPLAMAETTSPQDAALMKRAKAAMDPWLKGVDAGSYDGSYSASADAFRLGVTKNQWLEGMAETREPLGAVENRTLMKMEHTTTLANAPEGEYVVARYKTRFAAGEERTEVVVARRQQDGSWRISGYRLLPN